MEDHPFQVPLVEDNAADTRLVQEMLRATATLRFELTHDDDAPLVKVEALTKAGDHLVLEIQSRVCSRSMGVVGSRLLSFAVQGRADPHGEKKCPAHRF